MARSIYKIHNNNLLDTKIVDLNDMIVINEGNITSAKFDKYEIDELYDLLPLSRKFLRNQNVGNSLSTYSGWEHYLEESNGYSIWKFVSPSGETFNYIYNFNNKLYFNGKEFINKGEASSLTSSFDKVLLYDDSASSYIDNTTEAGTPGGTEFELMGQSTDYLYIGMTSSTFSGIKFEFQTFGVSYNLTIEYYNGDSGSPWQTLSSVSNSLSENTGNFIRDGAITWTIPTDWQTTNVDSNSAYWIRISSVTPVTMAKAYYIVPTNSVVGLLAMSSNQLLNEEYRWCTYNDNIYVTIKNGGATSAEGNTYIKSSSSTTNKQNFFVYNNSFTADFEDSTYDPIITITANRAVDLTEGIIEIDASSSSVSVILPTAVGNKAKQVRVKALEIGSGNSCKVTTTGSETIDGSSEYIFSASYDSKIFYSDGTNWKTL